MPYFIYSAYDGTRKITGERIEAESIEMARKELFSLGYLIVSIKPVYEKRSVAEREQKLRKVRKEELISFSRHLSTMLNSGIDIIRALEVLQRETISKRLEEAIKRVHREVSEGKSFFEVCGNYPAVFPPVFIGLVQAGEASGNLGDSLDKIALHLEKENELNRKVKSAFIYPALVSIVAVILVVILLAFVVPRFQSIFMKIGVKLPVATYFLMALSKILIQYWWFVLGVIVLLAIGFIFFKKMKSSKLILDKIKLRFPVFGSLHRASATANFVRTLSTLLSSGVPLLTCLSVARDVIDNEEIRNVVKGTERLVQEGRSIKDSLVIADGVFSPVVLETIAIGEETGRIEELLQKSAEDCEREVDYIVRKISVALEPLLTIAIGLVVAFIAVAIYLPLFDIYRSMAAR